LIRHSGVSTASGVYSNTDGFGGLSHLSGQLLSAYTRCDGLWSTYSDVLGMDYPAFNDLNVQPAQLTKIFDERTQEIGYTIVFSNNPNMTNSGYSIEREQVFSMNNLGITEATEQATLTNYSIKNAANRSSMITNLNTQAAGAQTRLATYWSTVNTCKHVGESKSISSQAKKASYSVTFTNDPSFINDETYLTRTIATQDNAPVRMHSPYFIVGRKNPLMHDPGQTQFGNASCTVTATIPRPIGYMPNKPNKPFVSRAMTRMFNEAMNNLLPLIASHHYSDLFVSKVTYNYTSVWNAELVVEAQYVFGRSSII